jgi:hypothetical protein
MSLMIGLMGIEGNESVFWFTYQGVSCRI